MSCDVDCNFMLAKDSSEYISGPHSHGGPCAKVFCQCTDKAVQLWREIAVSAVPMA